MLFCQVNPAFLLIQPPFSVTIDTCLPLVTICHAGGRAKQRLGVLAQLEMRPVAKARGLTYMASIDVAVMMAIIYNDDQWWCIISYIYNHSHDADYGDGDSDVDAGGVGGGDNDDDFDGFGLQQQVAAVQTHPLYLLVYARRIAVTLLMCSAMCSSTSNSQLMTTIYNMLMRSVRRKKSKSLSKRN